MSRYINIAIVLVTIALPIGPVVHDQLRIEVARWYLAAAANRAAEGLEIGYQLDQAKAWGGDLTGLRDYWLLRAEQALATSPDDLDEVIAAAVAHDPRNSEIGFLFALRLGANQHFRQAVKVLEATVDDERRQHPEVLNLLAYYRALAGIDLDRALKDIDQALSKSPQSPGLRDTRAWVLFQMGKPQQAIDDIDFAVKGFDETGTTGISKTLSWFEKQLVRPPEPRSADAILSQREAGELLWGRGVVHYHRAKILEALGRSDEAEKEFEWLRQHRLPTDDRLY